MARRLALRRLRQSRSATWRLQRCSFTAPNLHWSQKNQRKWNTPESCARSPNDQVTPIFYDCRIDNLRQALFEHEAEFNHETFAYSLDCLHGGSYRQRLGRRRDNWLYLCRSERRLRLQSGACAWSGQRRETAKR